MRGGVEAQSETGVGGDLKKGRRDPDESEQEDAEDGHP